MENRKIGGKKEGFAKKSKRKKGYYRYFTILSIIQN
jgi:hypothetical protein